MLRHRPRGAWRGSRRAWRTRVGSQTAGMIQYLRNFFEVPMIVEFKAPLSLMTADEFYDFVERPENRARSFELVRGEVIEVSRPTRIHGRVCINTGFELEKYARKRKKGYVVSNDSGVILENDPDTVRCPDVA